MATSQPSFAALAARPKEDTKQPLTRVQLEGQVVSKAAEQSKGMGRRRRSVSLLPAAALQVAACLPASSSASVPALCCT